MPDRRLPRPISPTFRSSTNPLPSNLYTSIYTRFAAHDALPRRVSTCNSLPIMAQLVSGGFAASLLPVRMLDQGLAPGRARRLEVAGRIAPHTMCLAWRASELGGGAGGIRPTVREVFDRTSVLESMRSDGDAAAS